MFDWLKGFNKHKPDTLGTVPVYDIPTKKIIRIPAAELAPGMIQARINGIEEVVWVDAGQLSEGNIKHPPFAAERHRELEAMYATLSEVYPISFAEWEEGFRRDQNPANEIAIWKHIADVYERFALRDNQTSPARRKDYFRLILTCSNSPRQNIWQVTQLETLSRAEAEPVVAAFYNKEE
ncbi:MAG: hypothetical protein H7Y38_10260 [Armatimonadetes bacterium]|nr:hypothetical protein [Armatimonadota bacterium]